MPIIPVIISGGAGTRLWPVSREGHPKPFMRLPDGKTLLSKTYDRAAALLPGGGTIMTVTNREHYFASKDQLAEARVDRHHQAHFLLEPEGRNTAAAVAHAALAAQACHGPEAVLVVMAADHLINDETAFRETIEHAAVLARDGFLVTCGVPPTHPETGFGYIQSGAPLDDQGGCRVQRFVEKPDKATAERYLQQGDLLWNAGIFCFKVVALLEELRLHAADILEEAQRWMERSQAHDRAGVLLQEMNQKSFCELPEIAINYAIMGRTERVAMVPARFDWSDIGSWNGLADLILPDEQGNRVIGDVVMG